MVSTRRGDYSTPEKNPPRPLECSPASRPPRNKEDEAEAEEEEAAKSEELSTESEAKKDVSFPSNKRPANDDGALEKKEASPPKKVAVDDEKKEEEEEDGDNSARNDNSRFGGYDVSHIGVSQSSSTRDGSESLRHNSVTASSQTVARRTSGVWHQQQKKSSTSFSNKGTPQPTELGSTVSTQ